MAEEDTVVQDEPEVTEGAAVETNDADVPNNENTDEQSDVQDRN